MCTQGSSLLYKISHSIETLSSISVGKPVKRHTHVLFTSSDFPLILKSLRCFKIRQETFACFLLFGNLPVQFHFQLYWTSDFHIAKKTLSFSYNHLFHKLRCAWMEIQNPKNPKEHAKTSKNMQRYVQYIIPNKALGISTPPKSDEKHKQYANTRCTICQGTENFLQVNLQVKLGFTLQRHNIIAERLA